MVPLLSGNILGASGSYGISATSAELYNPTTGTYAATGSLTTGRNQFQMVVLPGGNSLAAAGQNENGQLASAELYSFVTGAWAANGSLATACNSFQMSDF